MFKPETSVADLAALIENAETVYAGLAVEIADCQEKIDACQAALRDQHDDIALKQYQAEQIRAELEQARVEHKAVSMSALLSQGTQTEEHATETLHRLNDHIETLHGAVRVLPALPSKEHSKAIDKASSELLALQGRMRDLVEKQCMVSEQHAGLSLQLGNNLYAQYCQATEQKKQDIQALKIQTVRAEHDLETTQDSIESSLIPWQELKQRYTDTYIADRVLESSPKMAVYTAWLDLVASLERFGQIAMFEEKEIAALALEKQRLKDLTLDQSTLTQHHIIRRTLFDFAETVKSLAERERAMQRAKFIKGR
jgi:hypothetical protein